MEESYETFEEELGPPRPEPPPQKPVRQIRRPASLRKAMSIQNLTQIETPWENVTLNRCLFVAITILVLTSGFQRLHETLRGQGAAEEEEEAGLTVRRSGTLRHRRQPPEPETSLWEVMFWWLPDFDDEEEDDEEDDDGEAKRGKSKRGATARGSRGLRNRPQPDKKLTKQREGKLKNRRAKKVRDEEIKDKKEREKQGKLREAAEEEDEDKENEEEEILMKSKGQEEKKKKKKPQKA
uniref:uncharacterized protein n=1 Tax=Centroberyx gerrardi TaxID=166262 RepID=UPI003AAABD76